MKQKDKTWKYILAGFSVLTSVTLMGMEHDSVGGLIGGIFFFCLFVYLTVDDFN